MLSLAVTSHLPRGASWSHLDNIQPIIRTIFEDIAGLTAQDSTNSVERVEPYSFHLSRFQKRYILFRNADAFGKFLGSHLSSREHDIEVDDDCHVTPLERFQRTCVAVPREELCNITEIEHVRRTEFRGNALDDLLVFQGNQSGFAHHAAEDEDQPAENGDHGVVR